MFEAVANAASGQASRSDMEAVAARLRAALGDKLTSFTAVPPEEIEAALRAVAERKPDGLIILGGDGTARAAAEIVGRGAGVPIAPLPGGTMNVLPKKVFGARTLDEAIDSLADHEIRPLPGGEIAGRVFFLSAALGFAGSLARLRETQRGAFRPLAFAKAWTSTANAFGSAMIQGVRWKTRKNPSWRRAHTLVLAVGSVQSVMNPTDDEDDDEGFEIASLDLRQGSDLAQLGYHAIANSWRDAPMVLIEGARRVDIEAPSKRPLVVLDGEPIRLPGLKSARWIPDACMILAPKETAAQSLEKQKSEPEKTA
ncbi:MAG: diacylglycerol kinase family protein [Caulobacterales bacterium]